MTKSTFGDDPAQQVYTALNLIAAVLSTAASAICITLIYRLKNKTGHLQLLLYMYYFHTIFDMTLFSINVDLGNVPLQIISYEVGMVTGLCDAIMSNWMVIVAWYIVAYRKPFHVLPNLHWILLSTMVLSLPVGIYYLVCTIPTKDAACIEFVVLDIYDNMRITLIGINFLIIFVIMHKLDFFTHSARKKSEQEIAIRTVVFRLIPYPVVQAIARSCQMW